MQLSEDDPCIVQGSSYLIPLISMVIVVSYILFDVSPTSNNAYKDAAPPGTIQVTNKGGAFSVKIKWSSEVKYV